MLERALGRVTGRVALALQQQAARKFPETIDALILEALERWRQNRWRTFDEGEVNCTAQLYRWLKEAKRADSQFFHVNIELEFINLTPEMLTGEESVTTARRPDLNLSLEPLSVHVECKRLRSHGTWCRDYVNNGMERFVSAAYGAGAPLGVMVGYVQQVTTDGLLDAVNGFVATHTLMGNEHRLGKTRTEYFGLTHQSTHHRTADVTIDLKHVWIQFAPVSSEAHQTP
ncbi:hypothetical protein MMAGJ_03330 [Mycolicibacterium mageritense]|uniref:Restriction endonuclease n=2 Tax=Mycolicibacterium mageritense TaxID=53462 RepID=A0ABM7HKN2_MYCME|nr:hypothetical protein MMAGJ_03330 [Mycolicibacterium mageritense]CDO24800.1 hypothetical protein BN978_05300 [Mycolicibacterium mageritense DSM 44476 = CIP 104973]